MKLNYIQTDARNHFYHIRNNFISELISYRIPLMRQISKLEKRWTPVVNRMTTVNAKINF